MFVCVSSCPRFVEDTHGRTTWLQNISSLARLAKLGKKVCASRLPKYEGWFHTGPFHMTAYLNTDIPPSPAQVPCSKSFSLGA